MTALSNPVPYRNSPVDTDHIPLVDLKAQYRNIASDVGAAVVEVMERADFILGRETTLFEKEFSEMCGVAHGISCASGTDALHLGLKALGIGSGDEVIMPTMTFVATALAISMCGATPVLVDVDPETALIDPERIEDAITDKTRAVLPVHLYGQCADMNAVCEIAKRRGLFVVEDAAQAHGATYNGKPAGGLGDVGCFSFYPAKNLGAYGDAGMVTTNDPVIAKKVELFRNLGSREKYQHEVMGLNSRLDTLQAAILRVKLPYLGKWNEDRRGHATRYDFELGSLEQVRLTRHDPCSVYHLYVIRAENRDAILDRLKVAGIGAGIHYPLAVHEQQAYAWLGYERGAFPVAEEWARTCLSLPIYPELPEDAIERVTAVLAAQET
ncbi:MAG: DegT/DnrJ/EryC1/StrS family aminotransferase [Proteobacteria bacterium]|nr:DegT/DnrJ/EryC1/StrS family aminotransferase [Pseudomonadota bacterium]